MGASRARAHGAFWAPRMTAPAHHHHLLPIDNCTSERTRAAPLEGRPIYCRLARWGERAVGN